MNKLNRNPEIFGEDGEIIARFRNRAYKVLTLNAGKVVEGASVGRLQLKGAGIEIPALIIGERGRGRRSGVLPVSLNKDQREKWEAQEDVRIGAAVLGRTRAGKVKLLERSEAKADDHFIAVLRTYIGYRGSNSHTGDRTGEYKKNTWGEEIPEFYPFPGVTLEEGVIAQGAAGRAGSGRQLISLIPKDTVFRTGYSGRLYGDPASHYYQFKGSRVLSATWDERSLSDIF